MNYPFASVWRFAIVAMLAASAVTVSLLPGALNSRAVQNPSVSLDMVTTGNNYDENTNTMTLGSIESCLTTEPPGNDAGHTHTVHVVVQNVEDLIGWQARLNYLGDQMRPSTFNPIPFIDNTTGQNVSFVNLPIDQASSVHRDIIAASNIPAAAPGPQTALIGSVYLGQQNFPVSPDTPSKTVPDDTSYSAPSGGVLASLNLSVLAGNAGNPSLFMNVDDDFPNPPGSGIPAFNGTGITELHLDPTMLGDGYHGEGSTCVPIDCVTQECPPAQETPTPPSASPTPTPPPGPTAFSVDTDVTGNSARSLGANDPCIQVDAGQTVAIDITATNIPPYNDNGTPTGADDTGGIIGYEYSLLYDTSALGIQSQDINFLLAANSGSSLFDGSEPVPDSDGDFHAAVLDFGEGVPEEGSGVLSRLIVQVSPAAQTGQYTLFLHPLAAFYLDASNTTYAPSALNSGAIAVGQACGTVVTPRPTSSPTPTPAPTLTPTATPTPTTVPPPGEFHDAAIKRLRGPSSVRLSPGVPDNGTVTVVAGNARSDHADTVGIYLALLPPGGTSNFGGCSPAGVLNLGSITLLPGDYVTVKTQPNWQCANPGAVDGMSWTLKAVADVHGDDFGSCSTMSQMFDGSCAAALASDDSDDFNSSYTRPRPRVVAIAR